MTHLLDAVVHVRDVAQPDRLVSGHDDLRVSELRGRACTAHDADRLLAAGDLRAAAGLVEVQSAHLLVDLVGGDAERLHARRIEIDADFAADSAAARHLRDTGQRQQPFRERVVDEPAQIGRRHARRRHGIVRERAREALALHLRLEDALRQVVAHVRDRVAHIDDRTVDRRADLEDDVDVDHAFEDVSRHVAHVADARDRAFDLLRDLVLEFGRRGAGLLDRYAHFRERDVGVQIDRQADEGRDAKEHEHDEQHDRRDRMADRPGRNIVHEPLGSDAGRTSSPGSRNAPAFATTRSPPARPEAIVTPLVTIAATRTSRRSTTPSALTTNT